MYQECVSFISKESLSFAFFLNIMTNQRSFSTSIRLQSLFPNGHHSVYWHARTHARTHTHTHTTIKPVYDAMLNVYVKTRQYSRQNHSTAEGCTRTKLSLYAASDSVTAVKKHDLQGFRLPLRCGWGLLFCGKETLLRQ
jgi:hypothetical protein